MLSSIGKDHLVRLFKPVLGILAHYTYRSKTRRTEHVCSEREKLRENSLSYSNIRKILLGRDHLYLLWVTSEGKAKAQVWTL